MDRALWLLFGLRVRGWFRRTGRKLKSFKGLLFVLLGGVVFAMMLAPIIASFLSTDVLHIESTETVPSGKVQVGYEFAKTAHLTGIGRLRIGDRIVAESDIGPTLARRITPVGMTIGSNTLSPVSAHYEAPYLFTGRIHKVHFTIGHDRSEVEPSPLQD